MTGPAHERAVCPAVIGVLDVRGEQCVHAVAGQRDRYRPVGDVFGGSSRPVDVARRLLDAGASELYLADLDALTERARNDDAIAAVASLGVPLLVDAGPRTTFAAPNVCPIASLETTAEPSELTTARIGSWFGLDLRDGQPLASKAWPHDPLAITDLAVAAGFGGCVVLDVAAVGTGRTATHELVAAIATRHPGLPLVSGGGVRSWDDIDAFARAGCRGVLVGTALLDGSLQR